MKPRRYNGIRLSDLMTIYIFKFVYSKYTSAFIVIIKFLKQAY